jgi:signal transduction histidine kinase
MGLAICRRIATFLGGTITVSSRPGEGATFVVTLPGTAIAHPLAPAA